jgi:DNA-binding NarL/FixJ family response regulator
MNIRIILADDHKILCQGLKTLIENEPDMEVVGEAEDGFEIVFLARELTPDVVIMDIKLPKMNGMEATRQILAELPDIKIIALSMYGESHFVTDMLKEGAYGYLLKECAFEELAQAIRRVMAKKIYLSPKIAEVVVKDHVTPNSRGIHSAFSALTPREREVLQMIAEGKRTTKIADLLHISVKTVETYRQQIKDKLSTSSVAGLTKYAIREGLINMED